MHFSLEAPGFHKMLQQDIDDYNSDVDALEIVEYVLQSSSCCAAKRSVLAVTAQILQEIAGETMAQMAAAPKARKERPTAVEAFAEDEDDLAARLDAIRS